MPAFWFSRLSPELMTLSPSMTTSSAVTRMVSPLLLPSMVGRSMPFRVTVRSTFRFST